MNAIDYGILQINWTFGFHDGARRDAMVAASLLPTNRLQDFVAYCERTAAEGRRIDQLHRASSYPLRDRMEQMEADTADMFRSVAVMKGFAGAAPVVEHLAH